MTTLQTSILEEILSNAKSEITQLDLEQWHKTYLGKNSQLKAMNQQLRELETAQKAEMGKKIKEIRSELEQLYENAKAATKASYKTYDFSAAQYTQSGTKHPMSILENTIRTIFAEDGFDMHVGSDITTEFYNFDALNTPKGHPSRSARDTFYLRDNPEKLLRTQTTALQAQMLESSQPPMRSIAYGNVYRRDDDATHTPMFTQLEGLVVEENLTVHHLKSWIFSFLSKLLPIEDIRFRPSFFPFTFASAEVDIKLKNKNEWLELLGCGMVHPKILEQFGIDSQKYQGLAFGLGVERLAMLKWNFSDIRYLYSNDTKFLESVL